MITTILRYFGLIPPEDIAAEREEFGADEQYADELAAMPSELRHRDLDDTQIFDAATFADAAPRVAQQYAEVEEL